MENFGFLPLFCGENLIFFYHWRIIVHNYTPIRGKRRNDGVKFTALKGAIARGEIQSIYLLEGEDAFFRTRARTMIEQAVLSNPELNSSSFEGGALKGNGIDHLLSAVTALPFLSDRRVVFVRDWYPTASDLKQKQLANYFATPEPLSVLIISNEKKCEPLKKIPSVTVVDCAHGELSVLTAWVKNEGVAAGLTVTDTAARTLCEFCLSDMTRISTETQKLILYAKDKTQITEEDVKLLVVPDSEYKVYEMTEHVASKRYDEACQVLAELTSKNESKQKMFVALYSHFRRLLHVSLSTDGDGAIAEMLGVKEYAVKVARRQAQKFSKKSLKAAVDKLTELDVGFKSGKLTIESALQLAVFGLMVDVK